MIEQDIAEGQFKALADEAIASHENSAIPNSLKINSSYLTAIAQKRSTL